MIYIEEKEPNYMPYLTSLFIKFDYKKEIQDILMSYGKFGVRYNKKLDIYELPIIYLKELIEKLSNYDDITLNTYKEPNIKIKQYELHKLKTELFGYQKEAVQYGLNHDKWLLLDVPGLGKSLSAIQLAKELKEQRGIKHCFIVCGINSLKLNWKKEIEKHSDLDCIVLGQRINRKGRLVIGGLQDRLNQLQNEIKEFFIITNIETLRSEKIVEELKKRPDLTEFMLVDEIHVCKDSGTQQAKALLKLGEKSKYKLGMTGTLLLNNPTDLYVPLKWIGVEKSCNSIFQNMFCVFSNKIQGLVIGYKNLDLLKDELYSCSLRRTSEVLDLPEYTMITEELEMDTNQEKFYNEIVKGVCEEVDKVKLTKKSLLGMVIRLRQATALPSILTTSNIESVKINRAIELTKEIISNNEKVVIFSVFKDTVYKLAEELKQFNPSVNTGDIDDVTISNNIDSFQNDPNSKVFIGTISKVGTGITLTAARYLIFIDSAWTDGVYEQNWKRIMRIGQKNSVFIYNLITKNTIDEKVYDILKRKKALSEFIIDDNRDDSVLVELHKYIQDLKNF